MSCFDHTDSRTPASSIPTVGSLAATPLQSFTVRDNPAASRFEIDLGGPLALCDYWLDGKTARFPHTEVPPAFRGQGIASRLIGGALDIARERGWRVIPQCSAVVTYMRRHKDTQDLLAPQARAAFHASGEA